jgi:hypothetical protein
MRNIEEKATATTERRKTAQTSTVQKLKARLAESGVRRD